MQRIADAMYMPPACFCCRQIKTSLNSVFIFKIHLVDKKNARHIQPAEIVATRILSALVFVGSSFHVERFSKVVICMLPQRYDSCLSS
jgi:hypothetical protein